MCGADCGGNNAFSLLNNGLKVAHYSTPIKAHVGRFIEGPETMEQQGGGMRTVRGGKIVYDAEHRRIYIQNGAMLGVYSMNNYFQKLAAGMVVVNKFPLQRGGWNRGENAWETLIIPEQYAYPENMNSGWQFVGVDGQDRLFDFDYDDRGYVYTAYSVLGAGMFRDDWTSPGAPKMMESQWQDLEGSVVPKGCAALKVGNQYWMIVSDTGKANATDVYNVTTPKGNVKATRQSLTDRGFMSVARTADYGQVAIVGRDFKLKIFTSGAFVTGGNPTEIVSASSGRQFKAVASDGTNFYAVEGSGSPSAGNYIWKFTPGSGGWTSTKYDVLGTFAAERMTYGDGFLTVIGVANAPNGSSAQNIRLVRTAGGTPTGVPINNDFFRNYYSYPDREYARPPLASKIGGALTIKEGNKTYLFYASYSIADVFELQAGDSLSIDSVAGFGTQNPYNKSTEVGPFYGDTLSFRSVLESEVTQRPPVEWTFGNPESSDNTRNASTGDTVSHQYAGLNTEAKITAVKTVTVKNLFDTSMTDTRPVTLKVPTARIGIASGSTTSAVLTPPVANLLMVVGEKFSDASDGAIQGHYSSWVQDGSPSERLPNDPIPVGDCGSHSIALSAQYGPYTNTGGDFATTGAAFSRSVQTTQYNVRPFVVGITTPSKTLSLVTFKGAARIGSSSTFNGATKWTVTWTLTSGGLDLLPPLVLPDTTIGTIPDFPVPTTIAIPSGAVLKLDVSIDAGNLSSSCQQFNSSSETLVLETPDPKIDVSAGCAAARDNCTLTASSLTGASTAGWTYVWVAKRGDGTVVAQSTANPFVPGIQTAGSYTVELTATKTIFSAAKVTRSITLTAPVCGGLPTEQEVSIGVQGKTSSCTGIQGFPCNSGETISFFLIRSGYTPQACDTFTWTFGDGDTGTGQEVDHTYPSTGPYNVVLKIQNDSGSKNFTFKIYFKTGNNPDPDPVDPCPAPSGVSFRWEGNMGCSTTKQCVVGESVTFIPTRTGGLKSCDNFAWTFQNNGSSTAERPVKTFTSAASLLVKVTINNTKGSNFQERTFVVATPNSGCSGFANALQVSTDYKGLSSGCTKYGNPGICQAGEEFEFEASFTGGYTKQSCDKFEWDFDDGTEKVTTTSDKVTHTFAGSKTTYAVKLRAYNTNGSTTAPFNLSISGNPTVPAPVIDISGPSTGAINGALTFTATSNEANTTDWRWTFDDGAIDNSQSGTTSTTSTVSHAYGTARTFTITVRARNGVGGPQSVKTKQVVITTVPEIRYLLPVVTHTAGLNDSSWRTDVQIFTPDPTVSASKPLVLNVEFKGIRKTLNITKSTTIYEDFLTLITSAQEQGPVFISTMADKAPQIWTRTYNQSLAGTFGQFIPAIVLSGTSSSGASGPGVQAAPKNFYLAGLRNDNRYRTNIGLMNPTSGTMGVQVSAFDDEKALLIGSFNLTVSPFALAQFNIASQIPNLPANRPFSVFVRLNGDAPNFMAYSSMIDGFTNDPVFATAVPDTEVMSTDNARIVLPGVGHTGNWRSDVSVFNPDSRAISFDLSYYDSSGFKTAEARNLTLSGNTFLQLDDLLRAGVLSPQPADGTGVLRIDTNITQGAYPFVFSRTYFDRGPLGSYGQGIPGFQASRANVKTNKPAYIPAVRSDSNYYTNIGLVNLSDVPTKVQVTLLNSDTGVAGPSMQFDLGPNQSIIRSRVDGKDLLKFLDNNATIGSFKVDILQGGGSVWAFGSVIDLRTSDPEYVAAIPAQQ